MDYRSEEGADLLLAAAAAGNTAVLGELLDRGVPVDSRRPPNGDTALLISAGDAERPDAARLLLSRGADPNARDWMGRTALFRAASGVNTGMIELLAEHGADPNIQDNTGRTALMTAADLCWYWNVQALLAHRSDPAIRDQRGRSAPRAELRFGGRS